MSSISKGKKYVNFLSFNNDDMNIHTYIHAYIHTYIHTYMHTYIALYVSSRSSTIGTNWGHELS